MTTTCERCGCNGAEPAVLDLNSGHMLCHACKAIALNRIARRALYFKECSHAWGAWTLTRRDAKRRGSWWHRECLRCRVVDDELSRNKPSDD